MESRSSFNGKERDDDGEFGTVTHYDYGFRIYNPGIGKFLSVDPLAKSYPWYTPYQFAGNTPIWAIDIDGLEPGYFQMIEVPSRRAPIPRCSPMPTAPTRASRPHRPAGRRWACRAP